MKKPEYKSIQVPKEVVLFAGNVQGVPTKYFGMKYEYEYIVWPEWKENLLELRCYKTEDVKDNCYEEPFKMPEEWTTWIDVDNKKWVTRDSMGGKWGKKTIGSLIYQYYTGYGRFKDVKLLNSDILKKEPAFISEGEEGISVIAKWQQNINNENLKKGTERKDARTHHLMLQAKPLTKAFLNWHENTAMKDSRYLIYKRTNCKKFEAFCTHCQNHLTIESARCKRNKTAKCPSCGSRVHMKSGGSISHLEDTVWTELVQDIDKGIMIRFIRMKKDYSTYGKIMREITEPCRVIIERGRGAVWYEKRASITIHTEKEPYKKNNKEGCIRSYNFPMEKNFGGVYQKNLRSVLKKAYPYHTFWAFFERKGRKKVEQYDVYDFFDAYSRFPLLESLEKTEKCKIVDYLCDGKRRNFEEFNRKAKNVSELLGISRQQYREIQNPDMEQIRMLHILNEKGIRVDEKGLNQLRFATSEYSRKNEIETILKHMSIRKFLKYVKNKNLHDVKEYYFDYLDMAEQNGFNMKNTFVLFPKNIREAHDEVSDIINEQRNKKQLEEERKQDKDIMEVEQKIRKKFTFEDDNLIIRPAKTAVEILKEGQTQHICVGNGNYRNKMIREKSFILFLRKKEEKDKPFYTVEITPDYHIIQRHGKYNEQGEEVKMVDAFLKKFVEVKSNGKEHYAAG